MTTPIQRNLAPTGGRALQKSERLPESKRLSPPDRWPAVFVWGIWLLMLSAALAFGQQYAPRLPWCEEWYFIVPSLTGERPVDLRWLWQAEGTHRIPLPKLLWLSLIKLGGDFIAGMYFNVLILSFLAASMIVAARILRGRVSYSDAFFPIALLHWGQWPNLLTIFQVHQVVPACLAGMLLVLIAANRTFLTAKTAVAAGMCLVLLPFCGSVGLAQVPAPAVWMGFSGVLGWFSAQPAGRRNGLLLLAFALTALALVGLYLPGLGPASNPNIERTARSVLKATTQFVSLSFGPTSRFLWPASAIAILALMLLSVLPLIHLWRNRAPERLRALGLFSFGAASICLALAVGWGRYDGNVDDGRYVTFAVPAVCCVYFIWVARGGPGGRFVQMLLFSFMTAAFSLNTYEGLNVATWLRNEKTAFEQDLQAGVPAAALAERHVGRSGFFPSALDINADRRLFATWWRRAHQAGIRPLQALQPIEGAIETATTDHITGWAWNMDHPAAPMTLNILADGTPVATVTADLPRQDLREMGIGDGRHGYHLASPAALKDGKAHLLRVEDAATAAVIGVCVFPAHDGIDGAIDRADGEWISGWAHDRNRPDSRLEVHLYSDDSLIATARADQFREDLRDNRVGDGFFAFRIPTPAALKDGKAHVLRVQTADSGRVIAAIIFHPLSK
jgi:hypothetical protein